MGGSASLTLDSSGNATISHNLGTTPKSVSLTLRPQANDILIDGMQPVVSAVNASTITVKAFRNGSWLSSNPMSVYWMAFA